MLYLLSDGLLHSSFLLVLKKLEIAIAVTHILCECKLYLSRIIFVYVIMKLSCMVVGLLSSS